MTITNQAWVAEHLGKPAAVVVEGTVVDVVDAGDGERGAFLVVENDETGERARGYVRVPMTEAEQAAHDAAVAAANDELIAERERLAEEQQAANDAARAEAEQEAEKRLDERLDERIRAILAERDISA